MKQYDSIEQYLKDFYSKPMAIVVGLGTIALLGMIVYMLWIMFLG